MAALARRRGQRGAALALVLAVLVIVSLIGAGLVSSAGAGRVDAVQREQSLRCFWAAESALAMVRYRLYTDEAYRAAPAPVRFTNGSIVARAEVAKAGNTYSVAVVASNTLNRLARRLYQEFDAVTSDYWDDFALFTGPLGIGMYWSAVINGNVFSEGSVFIHSSAILKNLYCLGNLTMSQRAAIYESAFIGGSISLAHSSVIYGNSYPFNSPANPYYVVAPTVPEIDPTYYDTLLAQAPEPHHVLSVIDDINLAGQIHYVPGTAFLRPGCAITSTPGGGTLVVPGSLVVLPSARIGSNVTVICGHEFELQENTCVGPNAVVYAKRNILMLPSSVSGRSALIAGEDIWALGGANISGMVYAGRDLVLSKSTCITGLAFAKEQAALSREVNITYSREALPTPLPPGFAPQAVRIVPRRWRQM